MVCTTTGRSAVAAVDAMAVVEHTTAAAAASASSCRRSIHYTTSVAVAASTRDLPEHRSGHVTSEEVITKTCSCISGRTIESKFMSLCTLLSLSSEELKCYWICKRDKNSGRYLLLKGKKGTMYFFSLLCNSNVMKVLFSCFRERLQASPRPRSRRASPA